jgi:hypothetical protein
VHQSRAPEGQLRARVACRGGAPTSTASELI